MKKVLPFILIGSILMAGCSSKIVMETSSVPQTVSQTVESKGQTTQKDITFSSLDDDALLRYVEDNVYSGLVADLDSKSYFVENVSAKYLSKEYLEELEYNSKENIYFGYALSELEDQFQGTKFVFSLGDDGKTIVKEFEKYDDTYDNVVKNVAIGTGVILICITVSVVTGGLGAPAVSMIFVASAKTGTIFALSSGAISGVSAGIVTGFQTNNFDEALKSAATAGSEGFKWGAITGALSGGASQAIALHGATLKGLTMNEAAAIQKESGYPLDVIKEFKSMDQYKICRDAGLKPEMVNGKLALVRNIDLTQVDEMGRTNLERIEVNLSPLDPSGQAYELHHIGQKADSTLAILTKAEHRQNGNNTMWHEFGNPTQTHGEGNTWDLQKQEFWKAIAEKLQSAGG